MKSYASTLVLLLVVAALGAYLYFFERGPIADAKKTTLLRVDASRAQTITLRNAGREVRLQKAGAEWTVQSGKGPAVPADSEQVQSLLDQLQLVESEAAVPAAADKLKAYGLEKPSVVVTVDDKRLEFGSKLPFDNMRQYLRAGDSVGLMPTTLQETVVKPFDDWREKSVLRVKTEDATALSVTAPVVQLSLEKREPEKEGDPAEWKLTAPLQWESDHSAVNSLVDGLTTTKTTKFLEEEPKNVAAWGLQKPAATLVVKTAAGERKLEVGRKVSGGYAARNSFSPAVFVLPETTYGLLNRPLRDWRSKAVWNVAADSIREVQVTARGQAQTYRRQGEKWVVATGSGDADKINQQVSELLISAQTMQAEDFIDKPSALGAYGLDQPRLHLRLSTSEGVRQLQIGQQGSRNYARVAEGETWKPTILVLSGTALESFKPSLDVLMAKPTAPPAAAPTAAKK